MNNASPDPQKKPPTACVIGGGPAGLMAAEMLAAQGVQVDLFDAMASVGRKFLLAGKGGMNITHSEPDALFRSRYAERRDALTPALVSFGPAALRDWAKGLGIDTFVGTSGRVFPADMKAAPLLRAWLHRLRHLGVRFHTRHRWLGWSEAGALVFRTPTGPLTHQAGATILALGGGSWSRLGSDGAWVSWLIQRGIAVKSLQAANCGFNVDWSDHLRSRFAGQPLKAVTVRIANAADGGDERKGEFIITQYGVEGSLIYALSARIRETINAHGQACILLDLVPDKTLQQLVSALNRPRGKDSFSSHLRKRLGIEGVRAALLREAMSATEMQTPQRLASTLKALPLILKSPRPIEEAISSAGGVPFEALDEHFMLKALPGIFCAGEMLDWEAPTGGYLLTACFATGRQAGLGAAQWLGQHR